MEKDYLEEVGRIFDIQRFSIHDGPGIRTIIFLKGCIFRCQWCCNPESQRFEVEEMVVNHKTKIIGKDVTVREVLAEIEKDRPYYRRSGGGVTLSGGECMCQPEFARALLHGCKEIGITTAVETTAGVDYSIVENLLPVLDYILMDIKHMNSEKHKKFTGRDNKVILENAIKIAKTGANLIIRVPVVPTFNHLPEEIRAIAQFAKTLPGVKRMHLLPYHRLGQDKYTGLNRPYTLDGMKPPASQAMEELVHIVREEGLDCQIGG